MSWRDRPYPQDESSGYDDGESIGMGFPKPTPYVKYLLLANIGIFVLTSIVQNRIELLFALFGAMGWESFIQPWRLITYQFLHGSVQHIFFNMLGVYFFGPPLERYWGSRRFLFFYLTCGVGGGLAFILLSTLLNMPVPIIGASGAVLGLLAACALLFPRMIIILMVFPVPIRIAVILLISLYSLSVLRDRDLADACHLAGMVTGFIYVWAGPYWQQLGANRRRAMRQKLIDQEPEDQRRVDQILDKVHQHGIQSLTWKEKRTLRAITRRQQLRDDLRKKFK